MTTKLTTWLSALAALALLGSCGQSADTAAADGAKTAEPAAAAAPADPKSDKGVGPISSVELGALDNALAAHGKEIFDSKCAACHKMDERYGGPALRKVTERRAPEYIMNMILNSSEMVTKSPTAMKLLEEYLTPMPMQNVTKDDARALLEYLRLEMQAGATTASK